MVKRFSKAGFFTIKYESFLDDIINGMDEFNISIDTMKQDIKILNKERFG